MEKALISVSVPMYSYNIIMRKMFFALKRQNQTDIIIWAKIDVYGQNIDSSLTSL